MKTTFIDEYRLHRLHVTRNLFCADAKEIEAALDLRPTSTRRGRILKKRPSAYSPGYMGWNALMMVLAPARVSIGGLLFASEEKKCQFDRLSDWAVKHAGYINETMQGFCEFNLWHLNH